MLLAKRRGARGISVTRVPRSPPRGEVAKSNGQYHGPRDRRLRPIIRHPVEIRHLRYFLAVAEAGSYTRAANRLGLSQPAVSEQMRRLQSTLHVSLFRREGKRICLTPTGLIFEEYARSVLREIEQLLLELSLESKTNRTRRKACLTRAVAI